MDSTAYLDLRNGEREPLFFFMLNAFLQSRIETDHESDGDEEVNVYLAGLLHSLVDGRFYADNVDHLAPSALDVCEKAEQSCTNRGKTDVYRTNADHRLMAFGLFAGFGDHVSFYRRATTPDEAYIEEARQFYSWASVFCSRLPPRYRGLSVTLEKLADEFGTYHEVLAHMATNHMDLMERLSPGQTWHLEQDAHLAALPQIEAQALDRMLDAYNRWRLEPNETTRKQFLEASTPYSELKPDFIPRNLMN
ncbi:MAG TPA: hypothetical protein QGF95_04860 [Candidatus Latescibacteria bacterium]|jgi:hypothetical protein|nr:hypothetical protein [Gemmatimonadaceae bacterium]MDP6016205.1 hypothetical protein [Candidatus Latescibacterota bacterium]HJP29866.1 hypothetical protein [Candidatus Latescibacterota bacterium]